MNYYFQDFQFKSDQLTLLKQGHTVKLRANEAKLLALLLSDTQRVFSKENILETVWAGKVISEQSIFQNISNLRVIFGDTAIVTHSKKGYQWQVPLKSEPKPKSLPTSEEPTGPTSNPIASTLTKRIPLPLSPLTLLTSILLIGAFSVGLLMAHNEADIIQSPVASNTTQKTLAFVKPIIAVLPIEISSVEAKPLGSQSIKELATKTSLKTDNNEQAILGNQQALLQSLYAYPTLKAIEGHTSHRFQDLQSMPSLLVKQEKKNNQADFILSTQLSIKTLQKQNQVNPSVYVTFNLLADTNNWQGVVSGNSVKQAIQKLSAHINNVINSELLLTNKSSLKRIHAKLQLLHDKHPGDAIVLQQFISNAIESGLLSEAQLLIEQLIRLSKAQNNLYYLGLAYLLNSEVSLQQKDFSLSKKLQIKAEQYFSSIDNIDGIKRAARLGAYLAITSNQWNTAKDILLPVIERMQHDKNYATQFDLVVSLAVFANKAKVLDERDIYLRQAVDILNDHNLAKERYASIYFQQGLFAEQIRDPANAELNYRKVLSIFTPDQENWFKERAYFHLSSVLINNNRHAAAIQLFTTEGQLNTKEQVILARVYQEWGKYKEAADLAKQAYATGVLSGELNASLNAALILVELSELDDSLSRNTYVNYLKQSAFPAWLKSSKRRLTALGLYSVLAPEQYLAMLGAA